MASINKNISAKDILTLTFLQNVSGMQVFWTHIVGKTGTGLRFRKNKQTFLKNQWLHFTHQKISKIFLSCENKKQSLLLRWIPQNADLIGGKCH